MGILLRQFQCLTAIFMLMASLSISAEIEGIYVLDTESVWKQETTLAINVDEDQKYSATLKSHNSEWSTEEVEVDENEFEITFRRGPGKMDLKLTYEGSVEDGKMSGTVKANFGAETELIGKLKKPNEEKPDQVRVKSDEQ